MSRIEKQDVCMFMQFIGCLSGDSQQGRKKLHFVSRFLFYFATNLK